MAHSASLIHRNNRFVFTFNTKASSRLHTLSNVYSPFRARSSVFLNTPPLSSYSSTCCCVARVSTESVEFAPSAPGFNFRYEIVRLEALRSKLFNARTLNDKHRVLDGDSRVNRFFSSKSSLASVNLDSYELFLLKCLVAAGQHHVIGSAGMESEETQLDSLRNTVKTALYALAEVIENVDFSRSNGRAEFGNKVGVGLDVEDIEDLNKLLKNLREIEQFYDCIGGIIGYQVTVLELLAQSTFERQHNRSQHIEGQRDCRFLEIHAPCGVDLSQNTEYASQAALWGIEGLPDLGEIYPLGGSADRLGLIEPDTGECLPAAMLPYCGRTLLEGLIRDLQAREYLYFKLYGKQCVTPVAIMTSSAKNNHEHITSLCERHSWFGRGQSCFKLFEQPLVPTVRAEDGEWLITKQCNPVSKPGGHGVIWKLAHDKGTFKWFHNHGRKGATVRQVSNVVAATDLTLLALAGIGLRQRKKLGFASCKRNSGATEGINVLMEKKNLDGEWEYGLSCVEYTEFDKYGISERPSSPTCLQAEFPANTNILYVDLPSAELVGSSRSQRCLPGMVLNTKKPIVYVDHFGKRHSVAGGRLECTMQNIADNYSNTYSSRSYNTVDGGKLDTFIVYNERRRVTSSAKKKRRHGDKSLHQTPDGALLDTLRNAHDLLSQCNIELPEIEGNEKYVDSGPPCLILLHPALGPLWEVSRQKFSGGSISKGSELQLEVAEFLWRNVQLDGSLIVVAENAMGSMKIKENGAPILQYGQRCGRCKLNSVKVINKGIDWSSGQNIYWKHEVQRNEALKIILHGNAEFEATDVILQGNHIFEVPSGYKLKITSGNSGFTVQLKPIEPSMMETGSWRWNYKIEGTHIQLELVEM